MAMSRRHYLQLLAATASLPLFRMVQLYAMSEQPNLQIEPIQFEGVLYWVTTVDLQQQELRMFWKDEQERKYRQFELIKRDLNRRGESLRFAMNAGMYHANRDPVGLYIERGNLLTPTNLEQGWGNFFLLPNGVFAITSDQQVLIQESNQFAMQFLNTPDQILWATQSGPLLLQQNQWHPQINPDSPSRRIRNAVGIRGSQIAVFVISQQAVNFAQITRFMQTRLELQDALYLDGSISAMYDRDNPQQHARAFEDFGVMLGVVEPIKRGWF